MRFRHLLLWDMRFQARYGFYFLYGFLLALYTVLLVCLPASGREKAAALLIFSDPAAMGLFFMGAIVLLEKSQRVTSFLAVSPVHAWEYVCSKVLSLSLIALLVAGPLGLAAGCPSFWRMLGGTWIASILFTLLGISIAVRAESLNQFLLFTVPVEILLFVPAIAHLFQYTPGIFGVYPANVCMDMVVGRDFSGAGLALTLLLIAGLFFLARQSVAKMWVGYGGEGS